MKGLCIISKCVILRKTKRIVYKVRANRFAQMNRTSRQCVCARVSAVYAPLISAARSVCTRSAQNDLVTLYRGVTVRRKEEERPIRENATFLNFPSDTFAFFGYSEARGVREAKRATLIYAPKGRFGFGW